MTRILFMYNNLVDSASLTESSEANGFPAENVQHLFRTKVWRTAGATPGIANLVIDHGVSKSVDCVALANYSWSSAPATLELDLSDDNNSWGSELITNGDMELTTNWADVGTPSVNERSAEQQHGGNYSRKFTTAANNEGIQSDVFTTVTGAIYNVILWVRSTDTSCIVRVRHGDDSGWLHNSGYTVSANQWVEIPFEVEETTGGAGAYIQIIDYSIGTTWYVDDVSFQASSATESLTWVATPTVNGNKVCIVKKFTSKSYRYNRLNVVYNPGDWDLGRMFLGEHFEPNANYRYGWKEDLVDPSKTLRTIGGQEHVDTIEMYRTMDFSSAPKSQAQWELYQKMVNHVGKHKDLFVVFDYDDEPNEMTMYGKFTKLPGMSSVFKNLFDLKFAFKESR